MSSTLTVYDCSKMCFANASNSFTKAWVLASGISANEPSCTPPFRLVTSILSIFLVLIGMYPLRILAAYTLSQSSIGKIWLVGLYRPIVIPTLPVVIFMEPFFRFSMIKNSLCPRPVAVSLTYAISTYSRGISFFSSFFNNSSMISSFMSCDYFREIMGSDESI